MVYEMIYERTEFYKNNLMNEFNLSIYGADDILETYFECLSDVPYDMYINHSVNSWTLEELVREFNGEINEEMEIEDIIETIDNCYGISLRVDTESIEYMFYTTEYHIINHDPYIKNIEEVREEGLI